MLLGLGLLLSLLGCHHADQLAETDAAISRFHALLDREKYEEIYAESNAKMKQSATEERVTTLLESVHRKMGPVLECHHTDAHFIGTERGKFVTVRYATRFARGKVEEQVTWVLGRDGAAPVLQQYDINSAELTDPGAKASPADHPAPAK